MLLYQDRLSKRILSGQCLHLFLCVKNVRIRSYSGQHIYTFGLNTERYLMRENADQNNSEYGHLLRSVY